MWSGTTKIRPGILAFVGGVAIVLASAVNLVHPRAHPSGVTIVERVSPGQGASADIQQQAIEVAIRRDAMSFILPSCDLGAFRDRFFVHVYTEAPSQGGRVAYLNRDFDVMSVPLRHVGTSTAGGERCEIDRPIDPPGVAEVVFGQFSMPNGACCSILWSRDIILRDQ